MPCCPRRVERLHHQLFSDSAGAKRRIDRHRSKQQRRLLAAENRRHPAGADQQGADPRDEGETLVRLDPFAQPVGRAGETARPESVLVKLFDCREIGWRLRAERKGKIRHRIAIEQYTGALEHDPKNYATFRDHAKRGGVVIRRHYIRSGSP